VPPHPSSAAFSDARKPLHHIGQEQPAEGPPASPTARCRAVRRTELVRVWSAERCKRLDFTGLSGTPKIIIAAPDSRADQGKSALQSGGEVTAKARLGNRCSIP
jgi:hypothetical protein